MKCLPVIFLATYAILENVGITASEGIASSVDAAYTPAASSIGSADQCDWTGSGGGGRGVRPIYLRCSRGTVSWRYPQGALRIVLSHSKGGTGKGSNYQRFRTCTKLSGPIRVYYEWKGKLRPIYLPNDGKPEGMHRCFYSIGRTAALYVEADESFTVGSETAKLQYDLEWNVGKEETGEVDDEAECRPCSKEELAKAYCRSDFVARGTVSAVQKLPDLQAAELLLRVTKTLRRIDEAEDNEVDAKDRHSSVIRVRVATACDARHGQGEFVIMAKRRLGDLTLVCAPRLEAWAMAVRELKSAPCLLQS